MSAPTAKQAVLNTLNITNEVEQPLTFSDVRFSPPGPYDGSRGNTVITVTPLPAGRLVGNPEPYFFNRLQMGDWLVPDAALEVENPQRVADLLPALNANKRVLLLPEDLANGDDELEDVGSEPMDVVLIAAEGSYGWLGQLTVTLQRVSIPLTEVMPNAVLPGLIYEGPRP